MENHDFCSPLWQCNSLPVSLVHAAPAAITVLQAPDDVPMALQYCGTSSLRRHSSATPQNLPWWHITYCQQHAGSQGIVYASVNSHEQAFGCHSQLQYPLQHSTSQAAHGEVRSILHTASKTLGRVRGQCPTATIRAGRALAAPITA